MFTEIMKLKRIANVAKLDKKTDALVSRQGAGLCFDFHKRETNV